MVVSVEVKKHKKTEIINIEVKNIKNWGGKCRSKKHFKVMVVNIEIKNNLKWWW
jgi:hypothetical protein